jgi:hypothetical protein
LWNGHAVHIVTWRDDSTPPLVALVDALGEHDLAELDFGQFKRWLDGAQGRAVRPHARTHARG